MANRRIDRHSEGATGFAAKLGRAQASGKLPTDTDLNEEKPKAHTKPFLVTREDAREKARAKKQARGQRPEAPPTQEDATLTDVLGDDWEAPLPPLSEEDLAAAMSDSLSARGVSDEDLDLLWDAIRQDEDRGARFLGIEPKTSAEMRTKLEDLGDLLFVLVDDTVNGPVRVGFAGFQLVMGHMLTHLYLLAAYRGQAPRLIPQLMAMAGDKFPNQTFIVQTGDMAMARMLKGVGFSASYILKWDPKPSVTITGDDAGETGDSQE